MKQCSRRLSAAADVDVLMQVSTCIMHLLFNCRRYRIVGEVEFHIILAKVQSTFCIIAFCDMVFSQLLHPEAIEIYIL